MAAKDEDKMHPPGMKLEAPKPVEAPKAAEPPPKPEEVTKALEDMVVKAEAAGMRDDPTVAAGRDVLDRLPKKEEKNASSK